MRQLEVFVNDVKAGRLTELKPGKGYTFVYTDAYVKSDLPPVSLTPIPSDSAFGNALWLHV